MIMSPPRLLDTRHIDRIILSVCADESDIHDSIRVIDLHDKPVLIPHPIEDDPIALQDAGRTKVRFDSPWRCPIAVSDLLMPGFQRTLGLWVSLPEVP
jgi:hypothetical protein